MHRPKPAGDFRPRYKSPADNANSCCVGGTHTADELWYSIRLAMTSARCADVGGMYIPNRLLSWLFLAAFVLSAEDSGNLPKISGASIRKPCSFDLGTPSLLQQGWRA